MEDKLARQDSRMSRTQATKVVEQVVEKILNMERTADIKQWMKEEYGLKLSSQEQYMHKAHKAIKEQYKPKLPSIIGSHIRKYENIAKRTEVEDPRTAILALQAIEKVLKITGSGINSDRLTVNQQINVFDGVDVDELKALLGRINQQADEDIIEINDDEEPF